LLPAALIHSFGDLVFFTLVWPHDAGRRLVTEGGADAGFWAATAIAATFAAVWFVAFRKLIGATGARPDDRPGGRLAGLAPICPGTSVSLGGGRTIRPLLAILRQAMPPRLRPTRIEYVVDGVRLRSLLSSAALDAIGDAAEQRRRALEILKGAL